MGSFFYSDSAPICQSEAQNLLLMDYCLNSLATGLSYLTLLLSYTHTSIRIHWKRLFKELGSSTINILMTSNLTSNFHLHETGYGQINTYSRHNRGATGE